MSIGKYSNARRTAPTLSCAVTCVLLAAACKSDLAPSTPMAGSAAPAAVTGAMAQTAGGVGVTAGIAAPPTTSGPASSAGTMAPAATAGVSAAAAGTAATTAGTTAAGTGGATATAGTAGNITQPAAGGGACGTESFAAIYKDILANPVYGCAAVTCHARASAIEAVGNLDLSTAAKAYAGLVGKNSDSQMCTGKPRVKVGDAKASLLISKLRDETLDCGTLMPAGGDYITDTDLLRLVSWINAGACNN